MITMGACLASLLAGGRWRSYARVRERGRVDWWWRGEVDGRCGRRRGWRGRREGGSLEFQSLGMMRGKGKRHEGSEVQGWGFLVDGEIETEAFGCTAGTSYLHGATDSDNMH